MPTVRIDRELNDRCYFVTFTVLNWINIFVSKKYFDVIITTLKYYQQAKSLKIFGYVIMKNHVHMIVQCKDMIGFIKGFKSFTTRKLKSLLQYDKKDRILSKFRNKKFLKKNSNFQIWNSKNWPKLCEDEDYFEQKLNYIHENPVLKGYVNACEDWIYSSARNYYLNDHSIIRVNTECDLD